MSIHKFTTCGCTDVQGGISEQVVLYADHLAALEAERAKARKWEPIHTAPSDGERPLYLACINEAGELLELAWNAGWGNDAAWDEPPNWCWQYDGDCPDATHWAYQDEGPPPVTERAKGEIRWRIVNDLGGECYFRDKPEDIPDGWTCRKVRVVDEIPAPGEVGKEEQST